MIFVDIGHLIPSADDEAVVLDSVEATLEQCRAQNRQLISEMRELNNELSITSDFSSPAFLASVPSTSNSLPVHFIVLINYQPLNISQCKFSSYISHSA